ncbi:MAG: N(4)-(beta-N-acetylglucosaminyl)-L-asparaginase [Chloroflexi bacterium]|nr:N(4)-(beta-N-acetylglucosaminyl)-L-asparaginase [Chloroflexota bacterium]
MIVVASSNGNVGIEESIRVLKEGGTAVDAVEAGIRLVEANTDDHTVGVGGYPNLLGEVELDASIMNGRTLESGAVGAVKGYPYPISIARKVMEQLPHVLLVGDGAARFAAEMGFSQQELLTEEVRAIWAKRLQEDMSPETFNNLQTQKQLREWVQTTTDPAHRQMREWVRLATDPERVKGTVNFIAQDKNGDIACGVSTSGWAWKYPGRLGDSPIIGAGNYADNRYGAAACTGMGEMAIRGVTAHTLIFYMKMGLSLEEAGKRAMDDLNDLDGRFLSRMNIIALDKEGLPAGFTSSKGRTYIYQTADMSAPVERVRIYIPIKSRWE